MGSGAPGHGAGKEHAAGEGKASSYPNHRDNPRIRRRPPTFVPYPARPERRRAKEPAFIQHEGSQRGQRSLVSSPVAITAGTVYVASYLAPAGHYAADNSYFASAGVDNAPLHALQDGVSGGDGVYA
ncbi:MAG TPA: DUF4082 domain-containing protein [Actinomycetes bacterium]